MSDAVATTRPGKFRALARCIHPKQAFVLALAMGIGAAVSGRPAREALVAGAAMLVVQMFLGLANDVADEKPDRKAGISGKPIAEGDLPASDATFVMAMLALIAIPLSLQNGRIAAGVLLAIVAVGWAHNFWLHRTWLSWLGWTATFGLLPAFLAYGGWAGLGPKTPPTYAVSGAAAALGFCLHFLTTLPDLVDDNRSGSRNLPLRIALRLGAPRLLVISALLGLAATGGLVVAGMQAGLRQ